MLEIDLEVAWGDFYMEDDSKAGFRVIAIGEKGKHLSIPAPLIRVKKGTTIRATITNSIPDSSISVFGMQERPSTVADSITILSGESKMVEFKAGMPGTYLYWIRAGAKKRRIFGEEEQLAGAFIIDPIEGSPPDRVMVMNIFSVPKEMPGRDAWEALTINGKSWPYTELFEPEVGDTLIWRVINASKRNHPMHLHGFYYDVLSRGSTLQDEIYPNDKISQVVTEFMTRRSTVVMRWIATRPGKWLYHCHLSFHVSSEVKIPDGLDHGDHMAGLVIGINVKPGETDLLWKGPEKRIELEALDDQIGNRSLKILRESMSESSDTNSSPVPGPLLVLKQYQPTFVTVSNSMEEPTSIHWHGLEIDSWSDGVPEWSSSDGKTSPIIHQNESFTYKLGLMRPGSFIYHSHLDDIEQLTDGLYGPMIVLAEGEKYDPETDRIYMVGWRKSEDPDLVFITEINGDTVLQDFTRGVVGNTYRIRLMNIAPAGRVGISIFKGGEPVTFKIIAKDGADLPESLQEEMNKSFRYGVGEAADFSFTPGEAGIYTLSIKSNTRKKPFEQKWEVSMR